MLHRNHQTAVFIDVAKPTDSFRERAERLVESLNHPGDSPDGTIKADIFSVAEDGTIYSGLVFEPEALGKVGDTSDDGLDSLAHANDYNMAVIVRNPS